MADNIIQRLIRLVLDRKAAAQVGEDAKKALSPVDQVLGGLDDRAKKLAGAIAAAFSINKLIEFGKTSVEKATESQKIWELLDNTIKNTGGDLQRLGPLARAGAEAFAAATIHDDESYAGSLQRMIALTGDTYASMRNMSLVANVAATFFKGDLAPAVELVSKVMNGNIGMLKRLGIEAKDAQSALDLLAKRSLGGAAKEVASFGGQLHQINNLWDDFQEEVGGVLTQSNKANGALGLIKGTLESMIKWVRDNQDELRKWVVNGINFAITAVDVLYRALSGVANVLQGSFNTALGVVAVGLSPLVRAFAAITSGSAFVAKFFNKDTAEEWSAWAKSARDAADAMDEWGVAAAKAGSDQVKKGVEILATPIFTAPKGGIKVPELPKEAPLLANEHADELDAWAKFDVAYWRKRIALTSSGLNQIKQLEKGQTKDLAAEFKAREDQAVATADLLFSVATRGLGPVAAGKARQNYLEAAEYSVRAVFALLDPLTAPLAGGFAAAAAQHTALAVAWDALSHQFGGSGATSSKFAAGGGLAAANASTDQTAAAKVPGVQVSVYVDGIDPRSTKQQSQMVEMNQQIKERYGSDSAINIYPASA